jgi:hypothetical protein
MRISKSSVFTAVVLALAASATGHAHHSFGMFDMSKCLQVAGSVKRFKFTYPHTWLWIEAQGPKGPPTLWAFEGNDPASLSVRGWKPGTLKPGDKVKITFSPLRDGRNGGALRAIHWQNGKTLKIDSLPCAAPK